MQSFQYQKNVMEAIHNQALAEYPNECCGWVIQKADGSQSYTVSKNLQEKYHKFDPEAYPRSPREAFIPEMKKLQDELDDLSGGDSLFSIVHSHIDVAAYFSAEDKLQMSDPVTKKPIYNADNYLVVSVQEGKIHSHAVFSFDEDASDFVEGKFEG